MSKVNAVCSKLVASEHAESTAIQQRCDKINRMWRDVKDLALARQEVRKNKMKTLIFHLRRHKSCMREADVGKLNYRVRLAF